MTVKPTYRVKLRDTTGDDTAHLGRIMGDLNVRAVNKRIFFSAIECSSGDFLNLNTKT